VTRDDRLALKDAATYYESSTFLHGTASLDF